MRAENSAFIRLLSDYIHDIPSEFIAQYAEADRSDFNWDYLADCAIEQSLGGIICVQLRRSVPESCIPDKLLQAFDSEIYLAVNRETELQAVLARFPDVPVVLMKGMVVRQYYPVPYLRTMGDIDIIIHPEDRVQTDEEIRAEGYERYIDNPDVWTYTKEYITFEIHDRMFYEELASRIDYRAYFGDIWNHVKETEPGRCVYVPDEEYHFLFLIVHLAKHILNKGYGFRGFLDLVFFCREAGERLDWKAIEEDLERLQLLNFTRVVFAFCIRWFQVEMSIPAAPLNEEFYEEITQKIFQDGTFGLKNQENEVGVLAKKLYKQESGYWREAVRLIWKELFPPYEFMSYIPWYRFLDGRPWLLPAAWVYRWFYVLTHKCVYGIRCMVKPLVKKKDIKTRQKSISDWGF